MDNATALSRLRGIADEQASHAGLSLTWHPANRRARSISQHGSTVWYEVKNPGTSREVTIEHPIDVWIDPTWQERIIVRPRGML